MSNLSTAVEVSKILAKNSCTYNDVEKILEDLLEHYQKERKSIEMTTREGENINAGSYLVNKI